jgi:hypothetical protein
MSPMWLVVVSVALDLFWGGCIEAGTVPTVSSNRPANCTGQCTSLYIVGGYQRWSRDQTLISIRPSLSPDHHGGFFSYNTNFLFPYLSTIYKLQRTKILGPLSFGRGSFDHFPLFGAPWIPLDFTSTSALLPLIDSQTTEAHEVLPFPIR